MKYFVISFIIIFKINLYAQDRWQKLDGPLGGFIVSLRSFGDTLITGAGDKGIIFYSFDSGNSWHRSDLKTTQRIIDFESTADGSIIAAVAINGLIKSSNYKNWQNLYYNGNYFLKLGKDYSSNIYAGSAINGQILLSTNNGSNWNLSFSTNGDINDFVLTTDNTLFAEGDKKVIRKKNNSGWEIIFFPDSIGDNYRVHLCVDKNNIIYASAASRIFLSTNSGNTWIYKSVLWGEFMYDMLFNERLIGAFGDETGWFGGRWGVSVSSDSGLTWEMSNEGLPPKFSSALTLAKSGTDTYLGTNAAGVFKSTDFGESWFPINNGLTAANTLDICFDNEGTLYSANWSNGFQKSTDKGETWEVINNGLTNSYCYSIIADDNGNLIGGTDQGIFRSTDKGENWVQTTSVGIDFAYRLYKDRKNRIYNADYYSGLFRTSNLGVTWEQINNNFINNEVIGFAVDSIENLYAGTADGIIYKSTNDGTTWKALRGSTGAAILRISISQDGNVYAATSGEGVIRSTDQGETWEQVNNGIEWLTVGLLGTNKKGEVFAGTSKEKIYFSKDKGNTWENYTSNLYLLGMRHIIFDEDDNAYIATDESVWRSNPDSVTAVANITEAPTQFALYQNYPNPFNPTTKIKYAVPSSLSSKERAGVRSFVELKVYDVLGNEVATLVNEVKEPGEYEVEWNASHLASGVYYYRLTAGSFSDTKKLVLLK